MTACAVHDWDAWVRFAELRPDCLDALTDRERHILRSREGIGGAPRETLAALGKTHGVGRERIRQIALRAGRKVRRCMLKDRQTCQRCMATEQDR